MTERPPHPHPIGLRSAAAIARRWAAAIARRWAPPIGLRWAAAGALGLLALLPLLGPCAAERGALRGQRSALREELDRFDDAFRRHRAIADAERSAWAEQSRFLERWIPRADSEPEILAALAQRFEGRQIAGLQISRRMATSGAAIPWERYRFEAPLGERALQLQRLPVRVSLRASYEDLAAILAALESRAAPLLLERVQIERLEAQLRLEADLSFIVRGAPDDR